MAKKDMVPIKMVVRYGVRPDGESGHIYPDFNSMPAAVRGNLDWSRYLKVHGVGPLSDKPSGIGESDAENPDPEIWFNYALVPKDFADEAASMFPDDVEQLTEAEFETAYNTRCTIHMPEMRYDDAALRYVDLLLKTGTAVDDPRVTKALDPDDNADGVKRYREKTWEGRKAKQGLKIHASKAKRIS